VKEQNEMAMRVRYGGGQTCKGKLDRDSPPDFTVEASTQNQTVFNSSLLHYT
jgi:hypothetical protein